MKIIAGSTLHGKTVRLEKLKRGLETQWFSKIIRSSIITRFNCFYHWLMDEMKEGE